MATERPQPNAHPAADVRPSFAPTFADRLPLWLSSFSLGVWIIAAVGVAAGVAALLRGERQAAGMSMWVFADIHQKLYEPIIEEWNAAPPAEAAPMVQQTMLGQPALLRRMLTGFFGGLPTADLIEVERTMAGQVFAGPVEAVGFVDLTDRVKAEGLLDKVSAASFATWSTRGRVFGLPHDIHPVLLGVRMDLVEAAGLSLDGVETWPDLVAALRPLMADGNGDGEPDRYLISIWPAESHRDKIEMLMLQAGTGYFDEAGEPVIASDANARVLAEIVSWCVGPGRIAADVRDFTASGNSLKTSGYAVTYFMPDWMCNVWKNELPGMSGRLELMPLPVFDFAQGPQRRRTSVWGGTMLGIPRTTRRLEEAWAFAKHLYLSPELARDLYVRGDIVTPVKQFWSDPVFDEPDAYFRSQPKGRLYLDMADSVPPRHASPYSQMAILRVADAATRLHAHAIAANIHEAEALLPRAAEVLRDAEAAVRLAMRANLFLADRESGDAP